MSTELEKREIIIKNFNEHPTFTYGKIAKIAKVNRKTVSKVIKNYKIRLNVLRKSGSGRPEGFRSPKKIRKAISTLKAKPNVSNRQLSAKIGYSESMVRKIKKKSGLRTYKVQTVPDRNATQNVNAKNRAKLLKRNFFKANSCCVMDDETYVLCDFSQLPGQEYYTATSRGDVEEEFRTKRKSKFPKKFLIWQAICSCGERSKFFITSGNVNSDIYVKECLQKRLLPFLRQHSIPTFFWPDLASCHYSRQTLKWYSDNEVTFVPKEANPPNSPELRPVERYWALTKRNLKQTKQEVKTMDQLKIKWRTASQKVSKDTIKSLMGGIPEKLKQFCL